MENDKEKIVKLFKGFRAISKRPIYGKGGITLKIGDIVWDEKNKEPGIILGVKPMIIGEYGLSKLGIINSAYDDITFSTFPEKRTCIILTTWNDPESKNLETRIRYTNSIFLTKIEDNKKESICDLDYHCRNECIMECSKECSLWKYRRK